VTFHTGMEHGLILMRFLIVPALLCSFAASALAGEFLPGVKRIVFLGDSITHAGHYVDQFAAYLAVRDPEREITVLGLGLPSETVSGLSESGHADGKFPRPDLHERLERVLAKAKPDLIFACYGMNDGIYQPLGEERFAAFRSGMERLRAAAQAAGARVIHLTPPVFDPEPIKDRTDAAGAPGKQFTGYDEVLSRYTAWLTERRTDGWQVVDLHTTMRQILDARRAAEPGFTFAKDGVHPSEAAHWIFSMELVGVLAGEDRPAAMKRMNLLRESPDFLKLVRERNRVLTDAWLTDIGHLRPGMAKGLPVPEAEAKAAELMPRIREQARALAGRIGRPL
jgi:lysophospholipase L1-like esterase